MELPRPILIITGRNRPHLLMTLWFSLVSGLVFVLGAPIPPSMGSSDLVAVWAWLLLLSGAIGLTGCYTRHNLKRGLGLERAGMLAGAGAVIGYAIQVYMINGNRALFSAGFCAGWAIANVVRALQISNDLRKVRGAHRA